MFLLYNYFNKNPYKKNHIVSLLYTINFFVNEQIHEKHSDDMIFFIWVLIEIVILQIFYDIGFGTTFDYQQPC